VRKVVGERERESKRRRERERERERDRESKRRIELWANVYAEVDVCMFLE